jgi:hypothetical protein
MEIKSDKNLIDSCREKTRAMCIGYATGSRSYKGATQGVGSRLRDSYGRQVVGFYSAEIKGSGKARQAEVPPSVDRG